MDESRANTDSYDLPWPKFGEATTFPFIIYSVPSHKTSTQMSFCLGTPKWRPITLCANLRLRWGLKQSCSSHWELFKGMWHITYTQGNQGDPWLLVVMSQIGNLTLGPSFGHNLCFNSPNGSCEPILDIYILRAFQWYKEPFNPMGFDPCNCSLKIWKFIKTPTPKVGAHLGVWGFIPSHSSTLLGAWMWLSGFIFGLHLHKPLLWSWAQS